MSSSLSVPQDDDKNKRQPNEDTIVSQDQMVARSQDVDASQPPSLVVGKRTSLLLHAHP